MDTEEEFTVYKMKQGEYLSEETLRDATEKYFGPVISEEETSDRLILTVEPKEVALQEVKVGIQKHDYKKDRVVLFTKEKDPETIRIELPDSTELEQAVKEAITAKNDFLFEVTKVTFERRKDRLKE